MTIYPKYFAQTPDAPQTDALSDVLAAVHFVGGHITSHALRPTDAPVRSGGLRSLLILRKGHARFTCDETNEAITFGAGDVLLLAFGSPFQISAVVDPAGTQTDICELLHCTFDLDARLAGRLLGCLPRMLLLRDLGGGAMDWLEVASMFALVEIEANEPGAAVMIARIVELLLIRVLRSWAVDPAAPASWLAGATDPAIGRVLTLLHARPAQAWTVPQLARDAGLSRSVFAKRFTDLVGEPPLRYLIGLRLDKAAELLRRTDHSIAEIAAATGYDLEPAFSRAFKHRYGLSPSHWRRG